ncbi:type II secretion system F family protein [Aquipuribacter sp. MA13-6]|uniref:type II secretion system F family protein n=1 Tax=unclassified Aquipuribacter TaxID=2635084 RepID=UPI003EECA97D
MSDAAVETSTLLGVGPAVVPPVLLLVAGLVMVAAGLLTLVVVLVVPVVGRRSGVPRSLAALARVHAAPRSARERELQRPVTERVLDPLMHTVTRIGRRLTPREQLTRVQARLDLAGNPPAWDVDRVASLRVLLAFVLGSVSLAVCAVVGPDLLQAVGIIAVAVAAGWVVPSLIIYQLAYDRSEAVLKELPDALDLLTISVESGLGFDAALAQVSRNSSGPLGQELSRVLQEMQIGTGRADALRGLGERTDVDDLRSFVSAMVQADSYGVPIAGVLRVQAREMRTRRGQRAEEAAQRVPVKILFPLIFGVLPALFVVVIGPGAIQAYFAFRGL